MPTKTKNRPGAVRVVPLKEIIPHPLNLNVYRPVTRESVADLADDIRNRGLLEPIVLTSDYYIIGYNTNNPDPMKLRRRIEIKTNRKDVKLVYKTEYTLPKTQRTSGGR